ncbi:glucoamylase family protein [Pollutibacter soli]|uniref:glucoamylase family protein n=1 Tax=Pollutibacter soli TaxID=3034157 RepID=UPI003013AA78
MVFFSGCGKSGSDPNPPPDPPASFNFTALRVNGSFNGFEYKGINKRPIVRLSFDVPLEKTSTASSITIKSAAGPIVNYSIQFLNNDSTVQIIPSTDLNPLSQYTVTASTTLKSAKNGSLRTAVSVILKTAIDSSDKFPRISDDALLDLVQKNNFKYFYDFGHPASGLARERNSSGDLVTSGGSGMGIMAIIVGIHRNFISRDEGLVRIQKITEFLSTKAERFHGAYPHWLNGNTGKTIPFSADDNGADLVETSYLVAGLLTARQYFNQNNTTENKLRADINAIWNGVDWDWFRREGQQVLYWHWSPDKGWAMNMKIQGWNECLITYVLAAASNTHTIPATVYTEGWARNGAMKNGNSFYGRTLPLGPAYGGPLFLAHYSFLAINPNQLKDGYAEYDEQVQAHTLINHDYCAENPRQFYGYSDSCWGLTASDNFNGYSAHSPTNDIGVIAPTAALSSFPYTPQQSMAALQFFYYKLGDKLWKDYGFVDAFSLDKPWFADSHLAIDQGPIVIMIENYRSGLIWNLMMSAPEIKTGLVKLGFTSPNL